MPRAKSYVIVDCEQSLLSYSLHLTDDPPSFVHIEVKDRSLLEYIEQLYKTSGSPVTIVTLCPYTQLIADYLANYIPSKESFRVRYAPPIYNNMLSETKFEISVEKLPSRPKYCYIYNHTLVHPSKSWIHHFTVLEARLSAIGFFENQDERACHEEKKPVYSGEKTYSPSHFSPAAKFSDKNKTRMDSPSVQRVKGEHFSRSRTPSPLFMPSSRPESPALDANKKTPKRTG